MQNFQSVGLYIRITSESGNRSYQKIRRRNPQMCGAKDVYCLRFHLNGKRKWFCVGTDLNAASAARGRKEQDLLTGVEAMEPSRQRMPEKAAETLEATIKRYLANITALKSAKTADGYAYTLNQFKACCKRTRLKDIRKQDLMDFIVSLKKQNLSDRTISNRIGEIVTFLRANDIKDVSVRHKYVEKKVKAYHPDELKALFSAATPEEWITFQFFLVTGARDQEVMHATWNDIDFKEALFTVHEHPEYGFKAGQAKAQSVTDFVMHIIPATVVDAFAKGDILEVLFVSVLFGFALSAAGPRCRPLVDMFDALTHMVFVVINILMKFAPVGAFGAMAFTVGKYGISSLGPLAKLIGVFYITGSLFVLLVMGGIAKVAGFGIVKFLFYIKEEMLLVLATSSSEPALPSLMSKLEKLGCSKSLVGLVVPTGYTFNTDGTSIYMTLAAIFVAQATNTHLTLQQQFTILSVAILTSKGASGVAGAAFIALVGTLMVVPDIPVAGMALILGIDRFMSMFRALINMVGNGVATLVIARWENELDRATLQRNLA